MNEQSKKQAAITRNLKDLLLAQQESMAFLSLPNGITIFYSFSYPTLKPSDGEDSD